MLFSRDARILVVDDDEAVRDALQLILEDFGQDSGDGAGALRVTCAPDGPTAVDLVRQETFDLVFLDLNLPGIDGFEVLRRMKTHDPSLEVLILSATDRAREAVEALRCGAFDYLTKPFSPDRLLNLVKTVLARRRRSREVVCPPPKRKGDPRARIITKAPNMRAVLDKAERVASTDCSVLVTGESGTGKELVAGLIHGLGPRGAGPFVAVNCAAIPADLLESELLGHEKGAFTGAYARRIGRFEQAHGGSLFLDEVSSLRFDLQAKLLRVLQEREFARVGGSETVRSDARLISAANVPLEELIRQGKFREDLYYRLNVIPLHLPPLRERPGDVALLCEHFLQRFRERYGKATPGLAPDFLAVLEQYPWPGNVRELRNVMERAVVLSDGDRPLDERDLPMDLLLPAHSARSSGEPPLNGEGLLRARETFERQHILHCLDLCGWNQAAAARLMRIHRNTLLKRMKALGITSREQGAS